MSGPTLAEVAAAREAARERVEAAVSAIAELEPRWKAAGREHRVALEELARIDLAMGTAKRAHMIMAAAHELGVELGEEPPVVVVPKSVGLPEVFELAALADGVGLYLHKTSVRGRVRGKAHAIRKVHVPQAVLDVVADRDADRGLGLRPKAEVDAANERLEELTAKGARYTVRPVYGSEELMAWQAHGKGDFGYDGPVKPLAPPGGGRWRWLKVADQSELVSAN